MHISTGITLLAIVLGSAPAAAAQSHRPVTAPTGQHPGYVVAMRDIQAAQAAILARKGSPAMIGQEKLAAQKTEAAQYIIYAQLAKTEKVNLGVKAVADTNPAPSAGGLHDARQYLQKALSDVEQADSNGETAVANDRHRIDELLQAALYNVNQSLNDYDKHK